VGQEPRDAFLAGCGGSLCGGGRRAVGLGRWSSGGDGEVKFAGKVPGVDEVKAVLK